MERPSFLDSLQYQLSGRFFPFNKKYMWHQKALFTVIACIALLNTKVALADNASSMTNDTKKQCSELLVECFGETGIESSNCLYSVSKNPLCENSALGRYAFHRWGTASIKPADLDEAPAFMGPPATGQAAANTACIEKVDGELTALIKSPEFSDDVVLQLTTKLDNCKKEDTNIMRQ